MVALLAACGLAEILHTAREIVRHPIEQGGLLFVKPDGGATCWGFELDDSTIDPQSETGRTVPVPSVNA